MLLNQTQTANIQHKHITNHPAKENIHQIVGFLGSWKESSNLLGLKRSACTLRTITNVRQAMRVNHEQARMNDVQKRRADS
jgi:hypothetical protein